MYSCTISQQNETDLINNFLMSLFNEEIPPSKIVDKYMSYEKNSKSYLAVISHIEEIRQGRDLDRGWLMPNHRIATLVSYNIGSYKDYSEHDKIKPKLTEKDKNHVYVLFDSSNEEILQYFLLENGKIKSFTLFGKGSEYWFFGYE